MQITRISQLFMMFLAFAVVLLSGCMGSEAQSVPTKNQYKAVASPMQTVQDAEAVQRVLDEASSDGWEYVGSTAEVMIFKK